MFNSFVKGASLMRVARIVFSAVVAVCLVLPNSTHVFAGDAEKATTKNRKNAQKAPVPARPTGVASKPDPLDAYHGGPKNDSITEYLNELGQASGISRGAKTLAPAVRSDNRATELRERRRPVRNAAERADYC